MVRPARTPITSNVVSGTRYLPNLKPRFLLPLSEQVPRLTILTDHPLRSSCSTIAKSAILLKPGEDGTILGTYCFVEQERYRAAKSHPLRIDAAD